MGLLVLVEIVPRFVSIPGLRDVDLKSLAGTRLADAPTVGHPYLAYTLRPDWSSKPDDFMGRKSHNSQGFRGREVALKKPEGVFRIVTVGGSSTYGNTPTSDAMTWPARLEWHLNERQTRPVEVLNAGVVGWNLFESLINLEFRVLDYDPDLVVVYHTINDARCALWTGGGEIQRDNSHWRAIWPTHSGSPVDPYLERSMTFLIWRRYFTPWYRARNELGFYGIVGYDPMNPDPYERGDPSLTGFESFERNLILLQAVVKARGAQVMLVTQGCDRDDIQAKSRVNQFRAMDYMGGIIKSVAGQHELLLCDARPVLEAAWAATPEELRGTSDGAIKKLMNDKSSEENRKRGREQWARLHAEGIFTGEVHLTDRGADLLATTIADAIMAADLLP